MELWKQIPSFPDYEVSSCGNVRKLHDTIKSKTLSKSHDGYPRCNLRQGNGVYTRAVHPLVLEAFVGPRPKGFDACHNDGDKTNNRLENLRWDTRKNNVADSINQKTFKQGDWHERSKITGKDAIKIRQRFAKGEKAMDLAKEYGLARTTIYYLLGGKTWKHVLNGVSMKTNNENKGE